MKQTKILPILLLALVLTTPTMAAEKPAKQPATPQQAAPQQAAPAAVPPFYKEDLSEGRPDAPINIVYFFALNCKKCVKSWQTVRPALINEYVNHGLLRLTYHEIYFTYKGWEASRFLRCTPPQHQIGLISELFTKQPIWNAEKADMPAIFGSMARARGLDMSKIEVCMQNPQLETFVRGRHDEAIKYYGVQKIPAYIVTGTNYRFTDKTTLQEMGAVLNKLLESKPNN